MNKQKIAKIADYESTEGKNLPKLKINKIIKEYKDKMYIPKERNKTQVLLAPVGLVASGKTTILKPLCRRLKLARISGDEIRLVLRKNGYNYLLTKDIAAKITKDLLNEGYSAALDSDCVSPLIRKIIKQYKKDYGFVDIWIYVNPGEKFIINKLTEMKYKKSGIFPNKEIAIADLKRRIPLHKAYAKKIKYHFEFNTSKGNIKDQVNEFVKFLRCRII